MENDLQIRGNSSNIFICNETFEGWSYETVIHPDFQFSLFVHLSLNSIDNTNKYLLIKSMDKFAYKISLKKRALSSSPF